MVPGQGPGHGRPASRQSRLAAASSSTSQDYQQRPLKQGASSSSQVTDFAIAVPQPESYDARLRHKQQKSVQVVAGWLTHQAQDGGSPMAPSPLQSTTFSTLNVMRGADEYYVEDEEEQQQQHQQHQQDLQQLQYMTGGMVSSRAGWSPQSTLPRTTGGGRQLSAIPGYMAEEDPLQQGPLQLARTASGDPLRLAGQQLSVARATTPHLYNNTTGSPVLAADGSVLQLAPQEPVLPPLARPLPPTVPYLVNSHGTPYGICIGDDQIYPLVLTATGEVWWGPDGLPLMCRPCEDGTPGGGSEGSDTSPIRALVTASGDALQGPGGVPVGVQLHWESGNVGSTEPATAAAAIDLTTGLVLSDVEGYRLRVDPATLELVNTKGNPRFDRQGHPLRLQAAPGDPTAGGQAAALRLPGLGDVSALAAAAAQPSWVLLGTGALLVVQFVLRMVLGFSGATSLFLLALLLLLAAAAAGAAALVARRPLPCPLPAPALLDMHGRPLRDARGQRLCLVTGAGHPQVITDSGDPVCLTVEGPSGESVLVPRLPLRRGGARQDLLVDGAGRALAGYQGGRLKLLLDAQRTPLLSPLGYPMALSLTGAPYTGPQGEPLFTSPDGKVLLGEGGQPLLAPGGQMLGLGAHGNLLQADGNPLLGPGKQRMYLGPAGTATAAPGGTSSHHVLARRLQGGAGGEEAPLPVLRLGPAPVVCSAGGGALSDALGRPLVAGPLGSLFSYHAGPSSWWWATELWKTASALAAAAAARRGEAPLGRAGSVLGGGGWGTRNTHLLSQYGTAVEGEEGDEEDLGAGEEEEEPDSPGAWPPAAVEYVAVNKAGMAVRSTKQPSGQWPSSSHQQLDGMGQQGEEQQGEDWDVVPMAAPQPSSQHSRATHTSSHQQGLVSSMAHQAAALPPSTTGTTHTGGALLPSMPTSTGAASGAGSLAAAATQQQQAASTAPASSSNSVAVPGEGSSWPHWVEGLLLVVQLSLAQHAVLLPWAEAYTGLLHLAQLPLAGAAVALDEWLSSSAAGVTTALHHLAHHPSAAQVLSALGSSATALAVLLGLCGWLVLAYPHDQYLQGELAALDPLRQAAAGPGPAGLSSQRVSGWWLEAVGAASGAGAAGPRQRSSRWSGGASGRGPAWGGYPPTATAAVAQWLLAAWPLPQAALAAGLLLVVLLRRLLPALQLVPLQSAGQRRTTAGGVRRTTTDMHSTTTLRQQQQQQQGPGSVRPALFYTSGAWLCATLALASAAVLLSSPWGVAEQQATLQQLPYLRQAADLALLYGIHDPAAAARGGSSGSSKLAVPQPASKLALQQSLQRQQQPQVPVRKAANVPGTTPKAPAGAALKTAGSGPGSLPVAGAGKGATPPAPPAPTQQQQVPLAAAAGHVTPAQHHPQAPLPPPPSRASGGLLWSALVMLGKLAALLLLAGGALVWWAQTNQGPDGQAQGELGSAGGSSQAADSPAVSHPGQPQEQQQQQRVSSEPGGSGTKMAEVSAAVGASTAGAVAAGLHQPLAVQVEGSATAAPAAPAPSTHLGGGKLSSGGTLSSTPPQGSDGSPAVSADSSVGSAGVSVPGPTTPNVTTDRSAPQEGGSAAATYATAPRPAPAVGGLRDAYASRAASAAQAATALGVSHALTSAPAAAVGAVGAMAAGDELVELVEEAEEEPVVGGKWRVVDGGLIWSQPSAEAAAAAAAAAREMPVRRISANGGRSRQASATGEAGSLSRRQSLA